ncbi:MAG: hypothetical protein M3069_05695, partial [Chloroflexota bacterium]|nr:hypothetical protein [Chloroflexota bacterium]
MGHLAVHFFAAVCVTLLVGLLLLGWRDYKQVDLDDQVAAVLSIFSGLMFGVVWKLAEFVLDWVRSTDLQTSNTETMTDLLWNDLGAVVGAVLATRVYCHVLSPRRRQELGSLAAPLFGVPSRVLDRHGV